MPSKTDKQRRIFRAAMGAKEGQKNVSGAAKKIAKDMSKKEIKKFLKKEEEDSESIAKKVSKNGSVELSKKAPKKREKTAPPTQVQKSKKGKGSYSRKKTIEESSILSFIDCILEKKYDDANKYLTSILNSKLQSRIEQELSTPLF